MSRLLEQHIETVSESVVIATDEGTLAAVLAYPQDIPAIGRLVVAGPHPLLGGTMENNVVRAVAEGLAMQGWITLRFDYRGVGGSEGPSMCDAAAMQSFWETSEVQDERERWTDLRDSCRWLREIDSAERPLVVVAYSFGNLVLSQWLEQHGKPDAAICIAPTLDQHDLGPLGQSPVTKFIIAAEADFATSAESTHAALPSWKNTKTEWASDRDGHFFRGHESWLCQRIAHFLNDLTVETSQ
jgi:alpha/beta superfamily hydrolase